MNKKGSLTLLGSICLISVLVATAFIAACAKPAPAPAPKPAPAPTPAPAPKPPPKPIELDWVGFRPATHASVKLIQELFVNRVNERAKGELTITWKGGAEIMSPSDIGLAAQKGVIDIGSVYVGAYEAVVPGIGAAVLTQLTPDEERQPGGAYDYLAELHRKAGLFYLGRPEPEPEAFFYTYLRKKRLEKPEDFVGVMVGSATAARPAVIAWGATQVTVGIPENYSALERGLVDGIAGQPLAGAVGYGWHELVKYVIDHPYYQSSVAMFMNLDSWNRLPEHLQNLIVECMIEMEGDALVQRSKTNAELRQKIVGAGVEFYKLSPDVADWYLETAYDAAWQWQQERFPEVTARLRELMSK